MVILGIETSCDETSAAIIKDGVLLSNIVSSQIDEHVKFGGVVPEVASRLHAENITVVIRKALDEAKVSFDDLDAVAVTRGPGLVGALHVGIQAAKTICMLYNIPLIPVNHLIGHIYANEFVKPLEYPLLAVIVSGGHSELVLMEKELDFKVLGQTRDDAIGESYDKVARVLGLPYPGGVPIDQNAKNGEHKYKFPTPLHGENTYDLSYSGLKTNVINLVNTLKMKGEPYKMQDICASFQDVAVGQVIERTLKAVSDFDIKNVVVCGGVSANSYLRSKMKEELDKLGVNLSIPPIWSCTDNAAMIAKAGEVLYKHNISAPLTISPDPNWQVEDCNSF